jgi:hypothetical protein
MHMKRAAIGSLAILLFACCMARADGVQSAFGAVGERLHTKGGGLAPLVGSCPRSNNDNWEYVGSALFVPISQSDSAVIVNTGQCNGGNGSGQYLVINRGGAARVVNDPAIGDESFLATNAYFFDDTLTLYGNRWLPNDGHCCPSKKANLEFNLKTGKRTFTLLNENN